MRSILPFDEINRLTADIRERLKNKEQISRIDIIDEMLDLFLLTYATANRVTGESLSYEYEPTLDEVMSVVDKEVAGKTWRERTEEYLDEYVSAEGSEQTASTEVSQSVNAAVGNAERKEQTSPSERIANDLVRIIETESHRIANESALNTAGKAGATMKKWVTMMDDKVRDNHQFLEGQSVPYDADFYSPDGDHARAPGLFALPENNINCRCELTFEK